MAQRFPLTSLRDAYKKSKNAERWVFAETVCSSVTMIYGRSNVGKSYLVASMLLSLLVQGREFLGMQPTDPSKLWKPAILWTDPGSDEEYAERIYKGLPDDVDLDIPTYHTGRIADPKDWELLTDHLITEDRNFVILDNLMGATGDSNESSVMATVFDGLTRMTNQGIPVVVLHHESEKGAPIAGGPPMGASMAVQKSRVWIQVRQTVKRQLRGGNTGLVIQGNALSQPQQIVAEPMTGPNYKVLNRGPWVDTKPADETAKQDRKATTLNNNAKMAEFVVAKCQGSGVRETARALVDQFGGTVDSRKSSLTNGALSKMLQRSGEGNSTRWRSAVPAVAA